MSRIIPLEDRKYVMTLQPDEVPPVIHALTGGGLLSHRAVRRRLEEAVALRAQCPASLGGAVEYVLKWFGPTGATAHDIATRLLLSDGAISKQLVLLNTSFVCFRLGKRCPPAGGLCTKASIVYSHRDFHERDKDEMAIDIGNP